MTIIILPLISKPEMPAVALWQIVDRSNFWNQIQSSLSAFGTRHEQWRNCFVCKQLWLHSEESSASVSKLCSIAALINGRLCRRDAPSPSFFIGKALRNSRRGKLLGDSILQTSKAFRIERASLFWHSVQFWNSLRQLCRHHHITFFRFEIFYLILIVSSLELLGTYASI